MTVTLHFMERVAERIGQDFCAHALAREVISAVAEGRDEFARFACKGRTGNPVFRVSIKDRGIFYVMLNPARDTAVTILPPGFTVTRPGKRKNKRLKGGD